MDHRPASSESIVATMAFDRKALLRALPAAALLGIAACSNGSTGLASNVPVVPAPAVDTAALKTLTDSFLATWNAHDAVGFTNLFTIDTQFTNPYGVFLSGRSALAPFNTKIFASVFSASTQSFLSVAPQPLAPGLTVADVRWSMVGATVPNWPPTQYGLISWVLQKQTDGSLQIAIMHNTIIPPPA
jgi:uncharacterized protein (TIGR02246 family)